MQRDQFVVAQEVLKDDVVRLPIGIDKGAQLDWSGSSPREIRALTGLAEGGSPIELHPLFVQHYELLGCRAKTRRLRSRVNRKEGG
jgi:hypothetical protein